MTPPDASRTVSRRCARALPSPAPRPLLVVALATVVAAGACASRQVQVASGPATNSGNTVAELNTAGSTFNFRRSSGGVARSDTIPETPEKLWPYLEQVYEALSIPVKVRNEDAHVLGNVDFSISRRLGDQRLSLLLNCGSTITGSMADQGEITMTVATQIRPVDLSGQRSEVVTLVKGTARQHGLSSTETDCVSTGRLEHSILTRLALLAAGHKS
jgi:hypothetical protein